MPHTNMTKSITWLDLLYMTYPKIFPNRLEKLTALFLSSQRPACVASSAPEAGSPLHYAAQKRPRRRGRAADLCGGHGGRGRQTTAVAPEGFSGRFGSGSDEVTEGVRTLAADFLLCFGMLSGTVLVV